MSEIADTGQCVDLCHVPHLAEFALQFGTRDAAGERADMPGLQAQLLARSFSRSCAGSEGENGCMAKRSCNGLVLSKARTHRLIFG